MARRIVVTVGMGRWPFDRLVRAISPLCREHDVFAQTGTSTITPPCPHAPFVDPDELDRRLREADVVITHAGNTVRVVQRMGRVPIAVAREATRGEMGNDHQVAYLRSDDRGPVLVARGELDDLADLVNRYEELASVELASHPVSDAAGTTTLLHRIRTGLTARHGVDAWIEAHLDDRRGQCLVVAPGGSATAPRLTARPGMVVTPRISGSLGRFATVVLLDVDPSEDDPRAAQAAEVLTVDGLLLLVTRPDRRGASRGIESLGAVQRAGLEPVERSIAGRMRSGRRHLMAARRIS